MKKALITGITWQDGAYLAELLLSKGYEVHGVKRRSSSLNTERIDHLYQDPHENGRKLILHYWDLTDSTNIISLVAKIQPDEIYNLGAQSHVGVSFVQPEYTANCDWIGALRLLDAIRINWLEKKTKFYQASTSELFGKVQETPQNENTPFYPRSPYGVGKLYAYWITVNYREAYNIFACNGILFNHESPIRWETFVTRKVTRAAAAIKLWLQDKLYIGNLDAKRDRGHAKDYVDGMWRMLQLDHPEDFVLATGETHSVREMIELAFWYLDIQIKWEWAGDQEVGKNTATGEVFIAIDPTYYRPAEVDLLLWDASKAKKLLDWEASTKFKDLIKEMVHSDLMKYTKEKELTAQQREIATNTSWLLLGKVTPKITE